MPSTAGAWIAHPPRALMFMSASRQSTSEISMPIGMQGSGTLFPAPQPTSSTGPTRQRDVRRPEIPGEKTPRRHRVLSSTHVNKGLRLLRRSFSATRVFSHAYSLIKRLYSGGLRRKTKLQALHSTSCHGGDE